MAIEFKQLRTQSRLPDISVKLTTPPEGSKAIHLKVFK